jgi:peptide/nickel transport system permease protein
LPLGVRVSNQLDEWLARMKPLGGVLYGLWRSYVVRRVAVMIPQTLAITVVVFVLIRLIPGDPAYLFAGPTATPDMIAAVHHRLGLDQPIIVQYLIYMGNLSHGDLGTSLTTSHPVATDIADRLPATLELICFALIVVVVVGLPVAALGARKPGGVADRVMGIYGLLAGSLPDFWWGLMLIFLLFTELHVVPAPVGQFDLTQEPLSPITHFYLIDAPLQGRWSAFMSALALLLLPGFTLAFIYGGPMIKHMRVSVAAALRAPYLEFGMMCGLKRGTLFAYAVRNSLLPVVTMTGVTFIYLISGAVLVETVFSWGGLGQYAVQAVTSSDYIAISGIVLVTTVLALVIYLLLDLVYAALDPRIRYG